MLIGASPGIADPLERAARREADERLADEIERISIEQFATRWAGTPVLSGLPPDDVAAAVIGIVCEAPRPAWRGRCAASAPARWRRFGGGSENFRFRSR